MKGKFAYRTGFLLVGTVIGAGFASGKEILTFFYAVKGHMAVMSLLCAFTYGIMTYLILAKAKTAKVHSLRGMSELAFSGGGFAMETFMALCYLVMFAAMLAGADALFQQCFPGIGKFPILSLFTLGVTAITVSRGIDGLMKANFILVPLMTLALLALCLVSLLCPETGEIPLNRQYVSPIGIWRLPLYLAMNLFLALGVMTSESEKMCKLEQIGGAVILAVVLGILLYVVGTAIFQSSSLIQFADMPTLYIAARFGRGYELIIGLIIWCGIFTTLISSIYPLSETIKPFMRDQTLRIGLISVVGFLLSRMGFATIVDYIYPVTGVIGLFFLWRIAAKRQTKIGSMNFKY